MRHLVSSIVVAIVLGLSLTGAQQAADLTVKAAEYDTYGTYLTGAEGQSLYLFLNDTENTSTCYDQCAENWPPLIVEGEPTAGEGVASSLLGTIERQDGAMQVTYNGWPLYYFSKDENPGDTAGQAVGAVWYLVSPYGVSIKPQEETSGEQQEQKESSDEAAGEDVDAMTLSILRGEGGQVYEANCAVCHGEEGEGGSGPALAGNNSLSDEEHVIRQIVRGGAFMPPFGDQLSDREVATVATYIMSAWENDFGAVTEEEVNAVR